MAITEKYCTTTGAGAHDGSSEANAWSFTEAVAGAAAGNRVNIKAGTYTLGASATLPAGTVAAPIIWRGYNSAIGDLTVSSLRSASTMKLDTTNYPIIDGGASWNVTAGNYNILECIALTGSLDARVLVATGTAITTIGVKATHTGNQANGAAIGCAAGALCIDSEFVTTNTGSNTFACAYVTGIGTRFVGCRFRYAGTNTTGSCVHVASNGVSIARSLLISDSKYGTYHSTTTPSTLLDSCTIYAPNADAVALVNGATTLIMGITNCLITDCNRSFNNLNSATSDRPVLRYWNRTRNNANTDVGAADWPTYNAVTTDNGTDYLASPSGDTDWRILVGSPANASGHLPYVCVGALNRQPFPPPVIGG